MKGKKVVIYARQSSGSDEQSESVEFQIEQCMEIAKANGYEVTGVYRDLNSSGRLYPTGAEALAMSDLAFQNWRKSRTFEKEYRPGLGAALAALPGADYLLVYEATRLCRPVQNSFLQQYLNTIFIEAHVELMTVKDGKSNPTNFADNLVYTIKSQVNDNQTQLTAEKSKKAMQHLKDSGYSPTCPKMYGIRYLGGKTKAVEVIKECIPVIKFVFEEVIKMKPYNWIVREMNRRFPGLSRGKAFYDSNFRHIVAQPFYCGMMYDSSNVLIPARQMEGKEIISYAEWKKANEIMERNRRQPQRRKSIPHPFTHILRCGYCGAKMISGLDSGKVFYFCNRGANLKRNEECPKARVTLNLVRHSDDFTGLKAAIAPFLTLAMFKDLEMNEASEKNRRELAQLEARMAKLNERNDEICRKYSLGEIEFNDYDLMKKNINSDKSIISDRISKFQSAYSAKEMAQRAKEYLGRIDDVMADRLETHVFEQLLREAVKTIYCFDDRVEIDTVYGRIPLRRMLVGRYRNFPRFHYRVIPKDGSKKVIDLRQAKIEVTYIFGHSDEYKVLVDFAAMKISEQI